MNNLSNNIICGHLSLKVGKKYYFKLRDGYIAGKVKWYQSIGISEPWMTCFVPVIRLANGNTITYCDNASYIIRDKENKILFTSDCNAALIYLKEKEDIGKTEAECFYRLPFSNQGYGSYKYHSCFNTMTSSIEKFVDALKKKCSLQDDCSRYNYYYPIMYYIDYDKGKVRGERVFFCMCIDDKEEIMETYIYGFSKNNEYFRTQSEAEENYNKFLSLTIVDFELTEEERIAEENKAKKEAILKKIEELKEEANKL